MKINKGDKIEFKIRQIEGLFNGEIKNVNDNYLKIQLEKPIKYFEGDISNFNITNVENN